MDTSLSGKLADCRRVTRDERDLHRRGRPQVARPSRAATASSRRSSPQGKILNVEARASTRCSSSAEIGTLITALGCGIGNPEQGGSFDIRSSGTTRSC